jgi:hypothetical protein
MNRPGFFCETCVDATGRPVRLEVGTVRQLAPGLTRRWRSCPVCGRAVTTEERPVERRGARPVGLAASAAAAPPDPPAA